MTGQSIMKRFFNLFLVYLKTEDDKDRMTLRTELELLNKELKQADDVDAKIKNIFNEILENYVIIYKSGDLIERYEAEDRINILIEEVRKQII